MNTYSFPNPDEEMFYFFKDLQYEIPNMKIELSISFEGETPQAWKDLPKNTNQTALQAKANPRSKSAPRPPASNPHPLQLCPKCHKSKPHNYFHSSGLCKPCYYKDPANPKRKHTIKGQPEEEIARNHEIIWGPEPPLRDPESPAPLQMSGKKLA